MKSKKTLAALIGLVVGLALFIIPIAAAHHPVITVSMNCNGTVSYTVSAWQTNDNAARTFTGVKVYWGSTVVGTGNFNAADNFTFSGSFTPSPSVTSITLTADTNGTWGDGYTGHDTYSDTATRPTNCVSVTTNLSSSSVTAGSAVHDSATLHGQTSNAGGTVTYKAYTDSSCTQGVSERRHEDGHERATCPDSDPITFNSVGDYYWQASYSGDSNGNNAVKSTCTDEHLVVTKKSPTIATVLSQSTITVGGSVNDTSNLTGATSNAGGTVTYSVYSNASCTGGAQDAGTKTVTNGVVPELEHAHLQHGRRLLLAGELQRRLQQQRRQEPVHERAPGREPEVADDRDDALVVDDHGRRNDPRLRDASRARPRTPAERSPTPSTPTRAAPRSRRAPARRPSRTASCPTRARSRSTRPVTTTGRPATAATRTTPRRPAPAPTSTSS